MRPHARTATPDTMGAIADEENDVFGMLDLVTESPRLPAPTPVAQGHSEQYDDYDFDLFPRPAEESPAAEGAAREGADADVEFDIVFGWPAASDAALRAHPLPADHSGAWMLDSHYDFDLGYDTPPTASTVAKVSHGVLFFSDEAKLLARVATVVVDGLAAGKSVFLVMTPEKLATVKSGVPADVFAAAERSGALTVLDAQSTLDLLVPNGVFDPSAFDENVAKSVRLAHDQRGAVCVYGEVVTLLWSHGNVLAALQLERKWNELHDVAGLAVLCAYSLSLVPADSEGFDLVSADHTHAEIL